MNSHLQNSGLLFILHPDHCTCPSKNLLAVKLRSFTALLMLIAQKFHRKNRISSLFLFLKILNSTCSKLQAYALIALPYWVVADPDVDVELFLNPEDQIMAF